MKGSSCKVVTDYKNDDNFETYGNSIATEGAYTQFPNLRALSFDFIPLSEAFPSSLVEDGKILPSLECVLLEDMIVNDGHWSALIAFLACHLSSGNRLDTLVIDRYTHVCRQVVEDISGMVQELKVDRDGTVCRFGTCL